MLCKQESSLLLASANLTLISQGKLVHLNVGLHLLSFSVLTKSIRQQIMII